MKNFINISHIAICFLLQILGYLLLENWYSGAAISISFYIGREIAQAEYRNIENSYSGLRKDMPLLGGLDPRFWTIKSFVADLFVPAALVIATAVILE